MTKNDGFPKDLDREKVAAWVHNLWALDGPAMPEDYTVADAVIGYIESRLYPEDARYEAWLASKQEPKALGVGPLDTEDPASRFAATEPLPVMTEPKGEPMLPIYETGTPPTHREWTDRLVISESYADDARDAERRS